MSKLTTNDHSKRKLFFLIAFLVIVLDRITKWAVAAYIPLHDTITIVPGLFSISHVENRGAAFGLFAESTFAWRTAALVGFSLVALIIVTVVLWKNSHAVTPTTLGLSLIMGGAAGNLWDRVVTGRVVDFLHFYVGSYVWPDFNVADSAIVVGAVLLVWEILFTKPGQEAVNPTA